MPRNNPLQRLNEALRQFEKAREIIRRHNIEGETAQATAVALATTWQKLRFVCMSPARRTGPGDPILDADYALLDARRSFQENHPDAPADFLERLEQALAASESSLPTAELSRGLSPSSASLVRT